ncbi:MAG: ferritin-like domain-containing protein [Bacteroidota bacterium]
MLSEKHIEVLNALVEINNDRIEGYERASKETEENDLKQLFAQLIQTSHKCKTELTNEVLKGGGKPIEGTTTSGKFFRAWMDVKAALTGKDRKTILSSCEFGEDAAIETYEKVLASHGDDLSSGHKTMITNQLSFIRADHDKIKRLRDNVLEHK